MLETRRYHPNGDSYCYKCKNQRSIQDRIVDPEKAKKHQRTSRLRKMYGMTNECYRKLYESQNGKCAVCEKDIEYIDKHTHIDHCHITNKIRGLLCHNCNTALGLLKEDKQIMSNLIRYLEANDV